MPSPPLVPDDRLIDTDHLSRITLGDTKLQREVLTLFLRQSQSLIQQLAQSLSETAAIAHTLKGSARGIGAFAAAECAERLELVAGNPRASAEALAELTSAVSETAIAIEDLLRLS